MNANAPHVWHFHNRNKSVELAEKVQSKLKGKVLKQVDHKTWVYCYPDEEPKPIITSQPEIRPQQPKKTAVIHKGVIYPNVRDFATKNDFSFAHVYRMLRGLKKNTIGIKYVEDSKNQKFNHLTKIFEQ